MAKDLKVTNRPTQKTNQQTGRMTNKVFANTNQEFRADCEHMQVQPTKRQASGYRNTRRGETSRGLAYKSRLQRLNTKEE